MRSKGGHHACGEKITAPAATPEPSQSAAPAATSINSTPDRVRTLADIALTAEGEKGVGHGYFFRTQNAGSVYILLAKAQKWNELRPTLTTVAANLAYAPQGVAAVQEQGKQLAEQPSAAEDQGPTLSPAVMLQRAKVYHTDSWGIEGPEGRIDSPAYNTTNFTSENPWTGRDLELVDTHAEYERYIANP
jgi:hypothetical protein